MGGRHEGQPRPRAARHPVRDPQPFAVGRHGNEARARPEQRAAGAEVAGVLDPDRVAGVEEHPRRQVERPLRSGDDNHLLRRAAHAARRAEVGGERLAQRAVARGILVGEQPGQGAARAACQDPGPHVVRKGVERRGADPERALLHPVRPIDRRWDRRRGGQGGAATRDGTPRRGRPQCDGRGRVRAEQVVGQRAGDEGAVPDPALEIALGEELVEGGQHAVAGHPQLGRQRARGGQPRPGHEPASQNRPAQPIVDLAVERDTSRPVEDETREGDDRCALRHAILQDQRFGAKMVPP